MTKKKRVVSKLTLLVVLLTLISCCFLGSTFARYTTSGTGSAKVEVAEWNLSITGEGVGETEMSFDKLSPAKGAYKDTVRTHATGKILVATITNSGDVDALVTLAADNFTSVLDGTFTADTDSHINSQEDIEDVFTIELYTNTSEDATGATGYTTGVKVAAEGGKLYIYAEVIWTSDDETVSGAEADKRDTWIGENVVSVSYTLSYTAVQDSMLPPAQP